MRELLREVGMVKNGLCHLKDFHSKYLTQDEFAEVFRSYEHQKKELKKLILMICWYSVMHFSGKAGDSARMAEAFPVYPDR